MEISIILTITTEEGIGELDRVYGYVLLVQNTQLFNFDSAVILIDQYQTDRLHPLHLQENLRRNLCFARSGPYSVLKSLFAGPILPQFHFS